MDASNLHTASLYINNLLLARGLLRNGKSIDFAEPGKGDGGIDGTMARVINLVHDMILRRDREGEKQESVVLQLRNLRSNESKLNLDIEKLQTQNATLSRNLSLSTSTQKQMQTTLKHHDSNARTHRDEVARLKSTISVVRSQCATDIRRRDLQIQKLKTHITAAQTQRGVRPVNNEATIVITPGVTIPVADKEIAAAKRKAGDTVEDGKGADSLRRETTAFLTQLCQTLSDEKAGLVQLARNTLGTLRSLQGIPLPTSEDDTSSSSKTLSSSSESSSVATLSTQTATVLNQLRSLLTNPAFVPVEELEAREEEIVRLRVGWEKMEGRWREAVDLMEHWRRKIERGNRRGGGGVDLEELRRGLGVGIGMSPFREKGERAELVVEEEEQAEEEEEEEEFSDEQDEDMSDADVDSPELSDLSDAEIPPEVAAASAQNVLAEIAQPNTSSQQGATARYKPKEDFTTIQEENTRDLRALGDPSIAASEKKNSQQQKKKARPSVGRAGSRRSSRIPVQAKLALASEEASRAREKGKDAGAEEGRVQKRTTQRRRRSGLASSAGVGGGGRRSRRRSTLTSQELENLIAGGLG